MNAGIFFAVNNEAIHSENYILVLAACAVINHVIFAYIHHRDMKRTEPQLQVNGALVTNPYHNFIDTSLIDHKLLIGMFVFIFVWGPIAARLGYVTQSEFGLYASMRLLVIYTFLLLLPVALYFKKKHLRATLWKELKSICT